MATYDKNLFAKLENRTGYSQTNETEILNPYVNFNHYKNSQILWKRICSYNRYSIRLYSWKI